MVDLINPRPGSQRLSIDQSRDTGGQTLVFGPFRIRYLFARSTDSRESGEPGQDYIAIQYDDRRLIFALCDGVSQSFYGDIAARFLGEALVEWLWDRLPAGEFRTEVLRGTLTEYLSSLTPKATQAVQSVLLPPNIPPMLRDVLEQKRAIGSETTFVCGAIEMPSPAQPEGRIVLAWMGNSELQLWGTERDRTGELNAEWDDRYRWSTRVGPKGGEVGAYVGTLQDVRRVLAYSDGIAPLRERLGRGIGDRELEEEVQRLGETPTSDDIAFLEIELWPERAPEPIAVPLPAPTWLRVRVVEGQIGATWAAVDGADRYEMEWTKPTGEREMFVVEKTWWARPVESGEHTLRVRALAQSRSGEWTPPRSVRVPPPVPKEPEPEPKRGRRWLLLAGGLAAMLFLLACGGALLWSYKTGRGPLAGLLRTTSPVPSTTPTHTPTARPTSTSTLTPTSTPTLTPTPTPTPTPAPSPTSTPTAVSTSTGGVYRLPEFPPPIKPLERTSTFPENALVVVGGQRPVPDEPDEQDVWSLRVAQQGPGAVLRFQSVVTPPVRPDEIRWVWVVYQVELSPPSEGPIAPLLIRLETNEGNRVPWITGALQDGQEAWVYGIDSPGGLGGLAQDLPFSGRPVLIRGNWRQLGEADWGLQVQGVYWFDREVNAYVPSQGSPLPTWTPRP